MRMARGMLSAVLAVSLGSLALASEAPPAFAVVRAFTEAINGGDAERAQELVWPELVVAVNLLYWDVHAGPEDAPALIAERIANGIRWQVALIHASDDGRVVLTRDRLHWARDVLGPIDVITFWVVEGDRLLGVTSAMDGGAFHDVYSAAALEGTWRAEMDGQPLYLRFDLRYRTFALARDLAGLDTEPDDVGTYLVRRGDATLVTDGGSLCGMYEVLVFAVRHTGPSSFDGVAVRETCEARWSSAAVQRFERVTLD